jgi:hypothetical protein
MKTEKPKIEKDGINSFIKGAKAKSPTKDSETERLLKRHYEITDKFTDELLERTPPHETLTVRLEIKIAKSLSDELNEFLRKVNQGHPRGLHLSKGEVIRSCLKKFLRRQANES